MWTIRHDRCFSWLGYAFGPSCFCLRELRKELDRVQSLGSQLGRLQSRVTTFVLLCSPLRRTAASFPQALLGRHPPKTPQISTLPPLTCGYHTEKFRRQKHGTAVVPTPNHAEPRPIDGAHPERDRFRNTCPHQIYCGSACRERGSVRAWPTVRYAGWNSLEWLFKFPFACLLELSKCQGHSGRLFLERVCFLTRVRMFLPQCLTTFATGLLRVSSALATVWTRCACPERRAGCIQLFVSGACAQSGHGQFPNVWFIVLSV